MGFFKRKFKEAVHDYKHQSAARKQIRKKAFEARLKAEEGEAIKAAQRKAKEKYNPKSRPMERSSYSVGKRKGKRSRPQSPFGGRSMFD